MVAGSDELMRVVQERGAEGFERSGVETRLGRFKDRRGVEVVGRDVEWVDGPEIGQDGEGMGDLM
jgi:hypothetical protein